MFGTKKVSEGNATKLRVGSLYPAATYDGRAYRTTIFERITPVKTDSFRKLDVFPRHPMDPTDNTVLNRS